MAPNSSGTAALSWARSPRWCFCRKKMLVFIAVNSEEGELVRGLMYELLDHYLGLTKDDWPEKLHDYV